MLGSESDDSMARSESSGAEGNATGIFLSSNTKKQLGQVAIPFGP